ncbi:MAG: FAD-dependent oxidoreductase [Spartobacteria bacterium]
METIAVLGGGSAGFTAARLAAKNGARVLFFMGDNADHASLCINAGCMPSKALSSRSIPCITLNGMAGWR